FERLYHADGERSFLSVTQLYGDPSVGAKRKRAVDGARIAIAAESVFLKFRGDRLAVRPDKREIRRESSGFRAAFHLLKLVKYRPAFGQFFAGVHVPVGRLRRRVSCAFPPEIESVDVSVGKKQGAMVRMVMAFTGNVLHHGP